MEGEGEAEVQRQVSPSTSPPYLKSVLCTYVSVHTHMHMAHCVHVLMYMYAHVCGGSKFCIAVSSSIALQLYLSRQGLSLRLELTDPPR